METISTVLQGYDQHTLVLDAEMAEIEADIRTLRLMSKRYSHDGSGFNDSIRFLAHLRDVKRSASVRISNERQSLLSSCIGFDMGRVEAKINTIPSTILNSQHSPSLETRQGSNRVFTDSSILRHGTRSASAQPSRRGGMEGVDENIIYVNTPNGVAAFESRILSNRKD